MFWLSFNDGSVFRCFLGFLFLWRFTGNNHLTSATKLRKVKRFMRGMKQLFCFSRHFWVSGSGWTRKSHQNVCNRVGLYRHNNNASFDSSLVKSAFQNWPQRLVSRIVLTYPVNHLDYYYYFLFFFLYFVLLTRIPGSSSRPLSLSTIIIVSSLTKIILDIQFLLLKLRAVLHC